MDITTVIGITGGFILLLGAARSDRKGITNPRKSAKERLFAIGGILMLIYSILAYLAGGNIVYIFLEIFVCFASRLKMMKAHGKFDMRMLGIVGIGFIITSYIKDQSHQTIRFIAGFIGIALGYTLKAGSMGRNAALMIGSILITIFSFFEANRIFFGINLFFSFFAGFHWMKNYIEEKDE